ncbi:MAG: FAD-dependent oxidoreductase, partial [Eubacteriales bacterium]|nr:FAD-dependent oxidoreductase [Eubacteriales bacterium]
MIEFTDNGDALTYRKRIPVRHQADVFIAGGGPAGVAAGVAAARQGADVFIAETYSAFGGAGVNMLVPAFMTFGDGENFLAAGIGREVYDYIASKSPESFKKHCPMSIPVETLKRCYDDMIADSGARFQFHTSVIDVIKKDGIIEYAVCAAKHADGESLFAVRAKVFIDCTGDGDLAVYAGAEYEYGDEEGKVMPATLCGIWAGIDWPRVVRPDSRALEDAFADGVFTHEDRHHSGMWRIADLSDRPDSGIGGSNVGHVYDINGADAADLTRGIVAGRRQLPEYRRYYRESLSGYENP